MNLVLQAQQEFCVLVAYLLNGLYTPIWMSSTQLCRLKSLYPLFKLMGCKIQQQEPDPDDGFTFHVLVKLFL